MEIYSVFECTDDLRDLWVWKGLWRMGCIRHLIGLLSLEGVVVVGVSSHRYGCVQEVSEIDGEAGEIPRGRRLRVSQVVSY